MGVKVARILLKELSSKIEGKLTLIAKLKLETSFAHDRITYFVLFCIILIIKNIQNALFRKVNDLCYPKLTLSSGFVLEAGTCSVKWIRDIIKIKTSLQEMQECIKTWHM